MNTQRNEELKTEDKSVETTWKNKVDKKLKSLSLFLTRQCELAPLHTKRIALISFGLICSAICLMLILAPLGDKPIQTTTTYSSIVKPHIVEPHEYSFPIEEYNKLLSIKKTIDSLSQTSEGKKHLEQWLKDKPGFMDSLQFLIRLHEERQIKK